MVICWERGADCLHIVLLIPLHPQTPSSLASFKSRLVLPFLYQLNHVVPEKRPLNWCSVVVVVVVVVHFLHCVIITNLHPFRYISLRSHTTGSNSGKSSRFNKNQNKCCLQ